MTRPVCDETCGCPLRERCLGRRYPDLFGMQFRGFWEGGDPVLRRYVVERSTANYEAPTHAFDQATAAAIREAGPTPRPAYDPTATHVVTAAPPTPQRGPVSTAAPGRTKELLQLIYACDARGHKIGCGCNERRFCALGRGLFQSEPCAVTLSDCLRCISSPPKSPETFPPPPANRPIVNS